MIYLISGNGRGAMDTEGGHGAPPVTEGEAE